MLEGFLDMVNLRYATRFTVDAPIVHFTGLYWWLVSTS